MCAAKRCIAIGVFDGVHLGHQAMLRGVDTVVTFHPHPAMVFAPNAAPKPIMTLEQRVDAIGKLGVGRIEVMGFTPALAEISAEDFLEQLRELAGEREFRFVHCDSSFGKNQRGDAEFLRNHGVEVVECEKVLCRGKRISSSWIREMLAGGDLEAARELLGHKVEVSGEVFHGKGEGRKIGFPTINIRPKEELCLRHGAYAVRIGGVLGVANYGVAPTMGAQAWKEPILEVNVIEDFEGKMRFEKFEKLGNQCSTSNLQPSTCIESVEMVKFLRDEREFADERTLCEQIQLDIKNAKNAI